MNNKFADLPLKAELIETLEDLKYSEMTPIQALALPKLLNGVDVIAQAKTGSGKTAAFGLAMLNKLKSSNSDVHGLVLCPTRELAEQVAIELRRLARKLANVKVLTLCGGLSESVQEKSLSLGAHIVVGTPGRVLRLLEKNILNVDNMNIFTLDEADRMLDMGFHDDILEIESYLPKKRQSLLFSATYPEDIISLSKEIQKKAIEVKVDTEHNADEIKQAFYEVTPKQDKNDFLYKILGHYRPDRSIVFCRTKKDSYDVAKFLAARKISAGCINGDLEQNERTAVLTKFKNKSLSVLVATDVASRGIDIKELAAVINYNMPTGVDAYIHRIGRTGRAGHKGLAFSFFTPKEQFKVDEISEFLDIKFPIKDPTEIPFIKKFDLHPPMETIFISGGKKDKLRPGDIVGAIIGEAKIDAKGIGDISVLNILSYVAIRRDLVETVIQKLSVGKIKKRKFKVGRA